MSVGLVLADSESSHEELVRRADLAMYAAKRAGGDRVQSFQPHLLVRADSRADLAYDLRTAASRDQFELHFQPIVDLADGAIRAVEALVRWRHPGKGLLAPGAFIDLAEQTGAIHDLERFTLDEACRVAATWPEIAGRRPSVSVNVSAVRLRAPELTAELTEVLRRHGMPPERLTVEFTESVALASDAAFTETNLSALRRIGVRLALDDFGTGFSSLSYLARFPVDLLKLDRTFLAEVEGDPAQAQLVSGVIRLADSLGVTVVAEGIERPTQVERLAEFGATLGQGYFFGRPMEEGALGERLARDARHWGASRRATEPLAAGLGVLGARASPG